MLYLITLALNTCIVWLPASDIPYNFDRYNPVSVDVYASDALDDTLADKLFPSIYTVEGITVQCTK